MSDIELPEDEEPDDQVAATAEVQAKSDNPAMAEAKALVAQIIAAMTVRGGISEDQLAAAVAVANYKLEEHEVLRTNKKATYFKLFGFGENGRHYLRKNALRLQKSHIKKLGQVLEALTVLKKGRTPEELPNQVESWLPFLHDAAEALGVDRSSFVIRSAVVASDAETAVESALDPIAPVEKPNNLKSSELVPPTPAALSGSAATPQLAPPVKVASWKRRGLLVGGALAVLCVGAPAFYFGYRYFDADRTPGKSYFDKNHQESAEGQTAIGKKIEDVGNKVEEIVHNFAERPKPDVPPMAVPSQSGPRSGQVAPPATVATTAPQSSFEPSIVPGKVTLAPIILGPEGALASTMVTAQDQKIMQELRKRQSQRDTEAKADQQIAARQARKKAQEFLGVANTDKALELFRLAASLDPQIDDYLSIGNLLFNKDRFSEAAETYGLAHNLDKKLVVALAARGDAYREQHTANSPGLAQADYQQALVLKSDYASAHNGLGNLALDRGDFPEAIEYYTQAIRDAPDFAMAYGNRGIAKYEAKDYKGAIADCQTAGKTASAHLCLGDAFWKIKNFDKAIAEYTEINPSDKLAASAGNGLGNVYSDMKNVAKAKEQYETALQQQPNYALPYNGLGNLAYRADQFEDAYAYFSKAIEKDPKFALAYSNRGNVKLAQNKPHEAKKDFENAVSLDRNMASAYLGRGKATALGGDWKAALPDFDRAVNHDPFDAQAYYLRGTARLLNAEAGSLEDLNKALDLQPGDTDALAARAEAYVQMGDYKNALDDLNALKNAGVERAVSETISIYSQMSRYEDVVAACTRMGPVEKNDDPVKFFCGLANLVRGETTAAKNFFAQISPSNELFSHVAKAYIILIEDRTNISGAISELTAALNSSPNNPKMKGGMLLTRASFYLARGENGDRDAARADFNESIEVAPTALGYKLRADFYTKAGNIENAIKDLESALKLVSTFTDASRELAQLYFKAGPTRSLDKASQHVDAVINRGDAQPGDYYLAGCIYLLRFKATADVAQLSLADEQFNKALALDPQNIHALLERAYVAQVREHNDAALNDYTAAVNADKDTIEPLLARADFFSATGNLERAVADIDKAMQETSRQTSLLGMKGLTYLNFGEIDAAIASFDEALADIHKTDLAPFLYRGRAYLLGASPLRAAQDLSNLLDLNLDQPAVLRERARAFFVMQNYARSVTDYQRLLKHAPDNAEAILMQYVAQLRTGDAQAVAKLHRNIDALKDTDKTLPAIELFTGSRQADNLSTPSDSQDDTCTNNVLVGEWHLTRKEPEAAESSFAQAIRTCAKSDTMVAIAKAEFGSLTSAWNRFRQIPMRAVYLLRAPAP